MKLLNRLPKSQEAKVTTIEESKDLNNLSLDELIGSLFTYEMKINHGKEPKKKGWYGFQGHHTRKKMVDEEKEMAMFSKKKKLIFTKMNNNGFRRS